MIEQVIYASSAPSNYVGPTSINYSTFNLTLSKPLLTAYPELEGFNTNIYERVNNLASALIY
jgi:hypothetical protein